VVACSETYRSWEGESLYGIEVREYVAVTMVELRGELDLFSLADLRETLNRVLDLSRPALVDLSGITFLDLESARELVLRYQLHADHLTLSNPSRWVSASIEAFGLAAWIHFHPTSDREEPPLVSEASS
jgi:anti-anti-sigma factor